MSSMPTVQRRPFLNRNRHQGPIHQLARLLGNFFNQTRILQDSFMDSSLRLCAGHTALGERALSYHATNCTIKAYIHQD